MSMTATSFWQEVSNEAHADRRRQKRIAIAFPISISGIDESGHFFSEATSTWDISERGCRFRIRRRVEVGEVVAIRVAGRKRHESDRALLFEVRWVQAEENGWLAGAECLQSSNLWKMAFPPAS